MSDNTGTVPPEEFARRRRAMQLGDELNECTRKLGSIMQAFQHEVGSDPARLKQELLDRIQSIQIGDDGSLSREAPIGGHGNLSTMAMLLDRLFAEAPKLETPDKDQTPAIQCMILLRGQPQALMGSLSITIEGAMRLLSPAHVNGKPCLAEQFFDVDDIQSIMLEREIKATPSSIITGVGR